MAQQQGEILVYALGKGIDAALPMNEHYLPADVEAGGGIFLPAAGAALGVSTRKGIKLHYYRRGKLRHLKLPSGGLGKARGIGQIRGAGVYVDANAQN